MNGIKKNIIRNMAKFKVVHSIPGRIRLRTGAPKEIYREFGGYQEYLEEAIMMLNGIEEVEFNYMIGTVLIKYNPKKTYEGKIIDWINEIVKVGVENSELAEKYGETKVDYVVDTVRQKLSEALKLI